MQKPSSPSDRKAERFSRKIIYVIIGTSICVLSYADTITGRVINVTDGDTITVLTTEKSQVKVRLAAIDAPERGQEYARESKEALVTLVAAKTVTVKEDGSDRYGRTIGWVTVGGTDANREMVRDGWAWQFIQYNKEPGIARLQAEAKKARRGLWGGPHSPMSPWDFRALKRKGSFSPKRS